MARNNSLATRRPFSSSEEMLSTLQNEYGTSLFNQNWVAQDWTYYDQVGYNTGATGGNSYSFFAVPAGQNDPNLAVRKTRENTNLVSNNQIGGAECFIATHLRMDIRLAPKARQTGTGVSSDAQFSARQLLYARFVEQLSGMGVITWTINQKAWIIQDQPFRRFAPAWGLGPVIPPAVGFTDGDPAAINGGANAYVACSHVDLDNGERGDAFSFGQPVFLAPNTQFELTLASVTGNFPAVTNTQGPSANQVSIVWLMAALQGWKVRPRQ